MEQCLGKMRLASNHNAVVGVDLESVTAVVEDELSWEPVGTNGGHWSRCPGERVSYVETPTDLDQFTDSKITVYLVQGYRDSDYWPQLEDAINDIGGTVFDL